MRKSYRSVFTPDCGESAAAGARNAIESAVVGSPTLSLEALIELDPDVIVSMVARDDLTDEERAARKARIASIKPLKAARTDNIYILEGQWVFGEGTTLLRLVDALEDIISAVEVLDD